jgi:hypothetical protein
MKPNEQEQQANNYQPSIIAPTQTTNSSGEGNIQSVEQPGSVIDMSNKMPNPLNTTSTSQQSIPSPFKLQHESPSYQNVQLTPSKEQEIPNKTLIPEIDQEEKITNKALIYSFILPPFGLYFGLKAKKQSKSLGNINSNAILAIILSVTFSILWVVLIYVIINSGKSSFDVCDDLGQGTHKVKNVTYVCQ